MRRLIIEILLGAGLLTFAVLWLEHRGAEKCLAADEKAVHKEEVRQAELHGEEKAEVKQEAQEFHEATTTPVVDAPRILVCPKPHKAGPVAATGTAGPIDHGEAELRAADQAVPAAVEWDSTGVLQAGHDADAQIESLEKYITNVCQRR